MPQHLIQRQPQRWLPLQQPSHQVHHQWRQARREKDGDLQDPVDEHCVVRALKWWSTHHHLIEQNAHTPNIQGLVMTTSLNHLGSEIIHRATERSPEHIGRGTPSKVRNLQHIIVRNQKVLWLQVPMDDLMRMKVLQTTHQLDEEMLRHRFIKLPPLLSPEKLV